MNWILPEGGGCYKACVEWKETGCIKNTYQAYSWTYEDDGYLFLNTARRGFDGAQGHTAVVWTPGSDLGS